MDHFVYAPSQWETTLYCNVGSHCLGAYTKKPCVLIRHVPLVCRVILLVTWHSLIHLSIHHSVHQSIKPSYMYLHRHSCCSPTSTYKQLLKLYILLTQTSRNLSVSNYDVLISCILVIMSYATGCWYTAGRSHFPCLFLFPSCHVNNFRPIVSCRGVIVIRMHSHIYVKWTPL